MHRDSLWEIVKLYGIPQRYVRLFQNIYLNSSCCVKTDTGNTDFFDMVTGVRQGCILSLMLFLLVVDFVMCKATEEPEMGIKWKDQSRLNDLNFADDIALLAESREKLQTITSKLVKNAKRVGLRISVEKTKTMLVGEAQINVSITNEQKPIESVNQFTYLGSTLTCDGDTEVDIKCRIGKASAAFQRL